MGNIRILPWQRKKWSLELALRSWEEEGRQVHEAGCRATSDKGSRVSGGPGLGKRAFSFWEGEGKSSLVTHSSESLAVPLACTWAPSLNTSGCLHPPYLFIPLLSRTFSPLPQALPREAML